MGNSHTRVRITGPVQTRTWNPAEGVVVERVEEKLLVRDFVRIVFFIPHDHFDIAAGVSHALGSYLRAVEGHQDAISTYTCCYWEPSTLNERGWQLIREALEPQERRYMEDYNEDEAHSLEKEGSDPYFGIYGAQDSRYRFSYHARLPWRETAPELVSTLEVTLPTEYMQANGPAQVRALASDMASRLPFASGHAGLALDVAYPQWDRLALLRPLIFRHPGFDIRGANIYDQMGTRVDGVHWMNFLGPPVLHELGGAESLRSRLQSPSTSVEALDGTRVVVTLGSEPEAGDLEQNQSLPAYRELARWLEYWQEPFAWGFLHRQGRDDDARELYRWWRRFLD
ncbi:hypothetical protein MEBOL_001956 [Melittangium boletus DSM 14713]|uniref:DUF3396 domain-containing protein n=1 Tax=Melittangium boletus DSM 14713 TaxID=1294270 RepID=A0A250IBC2_9BACT|nr:hypothetical protein MEBOL_001956 [Melittangium boletus DSM 14713]